MFYHVYKDDSFGWNRKQRGNYRFTIPHENGTDQPTVELHKDTPDGWTSLGDYTFTADTLTVSLSNETRLRAVFADAVASNNFKHNMASPGIGYQCVGARAPRRKGGNPKRCKERTTCR